MTTVVLGFAIAGIAVLWLLTVPSLTIEDLTHHDIVPTSVEYVTDAEYARKSRLNEIVIHTNTLDYILSGTIYADHYTNERLLHRIVPGESLTVWVENDSDLSHIVLGLRNSHITLDATTGMAERDRNRMWAMIVVGLFTGIGSSAYLYFPGRTL